MSKKDIALVLGVTTRTVTDLVHEGMPRVGKGPLARYSITACVRWFVERERRAARTSRPQSAIDQARLRKVVATARIAEFEAARISGEVVRVEEFESVLREAFGRVRRRLDALPGRGAPRLVGLESVLDARRVLGDLVNETLGELSNGHEHDSHLDE